MVYYFRYLGWNLTAMDNNCPAVAGNLKTARWSWACLLWILGREGLDTQTLGGFYLAVVQNMLLFGSGRCDENAGAGGTKNLHFQKA